MIFFFLFYILFFIDREECETTVVGIPLEIQEVQLDHQELDRSIAAVCNAKKLKSSVKNSPSL